MEVIKLRTRSGVWLELGGVRPEQIRIEDIAQGLSNTCRFAGQCKQFYSVAEHCCHLYDQLLYWGFPDKACLAALLHDAAEAYLHDLATPLKRKLPDYKALESALLAVICERYGLTIPPLVKQYDFQLFLLEFKTLFVPAEDDCRWVGPLRRVIDRKLRCWSPARARREFLYRFNNRMRGKSWYGQCWWLWCWDSALLALGR